MAGPDAPHTAYPSPYDLSEKAHTTRHTDTTNPFASPLSSSPDSSCSRYFPSAHTRPDVRTSRTSHHDSVMSNPTSPFDSYAASGMSHHSNGRYDERKESSTSSDLDRNVDLGQQISYPKAVVSRDPEKRSSASSPVRSARRRNDVEEYRLTYDEDDEMRIEEKAMSIIAYLSFLNPIVCFGILFWTIVCALIAVVLLPFHAISSNLPTFTSMAFPSLRLQLRMIYSLHINEEVETVPRPGMVAIVNMFSPILALLLAVCSWVVATFWFFSAVLGDPAGKDGHNDGRSAVLWIRGKWEAWLLSGLKHLN